MAVSIFNPSSVFVTLSTLPFGETAPLARALQSTIVEQAGFNQFNQVEDKTFPGFSADTPGIQARPIQLALDNLLLLGSLNARFEQRLTETRNTFLQVQETLQNAIRNENIALRNRADDILNSSLLAQIIEAAEQAGLLEDTQDEPVAVPKFLDFNFRPKESGVFGSTYTAVPVAGSLSTSFIKSVSLGAGETVTLADLVLGAESGNATHYVLSIQSELGGASVASISGPGGTVNNGDVIDLTGGDTLADYTVTAGSGGLGALDFISLIELNDVNTSGTFDAADQRGRYQTIAVTSNAAAQDRSEGANGEDQIREYSFYTESGVAYSRFRLSLDGIGAQGFTDALTAIQNGDLIIRIGEELIDGSTNFGQIDRLNSNADTLVVVFPFQAAEDGLAQNGVTVEIRSVNDALDTSLITARAEFP
ncbi:MAG: hypothetical protein RIM33_08660 [Alphaproteobacteria bacterium]